MLHFNYCYATCCYTEGHFAVLALSVILNVDVVSVTVPATILRTGKLELYTSDRTFLFFQTIHKRDTQR